MREPRWLCLATLGAFALAAQLTNVGAQTAQAPYIRAERGPATKAFGQKIAARIFSNEFTSTREQAIKHSASSVPGHACPAETKIAIIEILPYPVAPQAVSWIERYVVECEPRARRNLMLFLENKKSRAIELLPGETKADPRLQRDAIRAAKAAAAGANPQGCEKSWVTDTREIEPYKDGSTPWSERWKFDLCGKSAEVEMSFAPAGGAGTSFGAKLVK